MELCKMTALEQFKASPAWDPRYDLPTCPRLNNPWLYMAYADVVLYQAEDGTVPVESLIAFIDACEITPGALHRWPSGAGGGTSQDEVIGMAHLDPDTAKYILSYLDSQGGYYNIAGEKQTRFLQFNLYRFVWLRPYLVSASCGKVGLGGQLLWAGMCVLDAMNSENGGKLRTYLMSRNMRDLFFCKLAMKFWRWRMKAKGWTFKSCLAKEPGEYPIFAELAKDAWL